MKYISRNLENVVNQVTKEYPVVLVTGPRQVGKTTMLQKLMEGTNISHRLFSLYWDEGRKKIEKFSEESRYPKKDEVTSYNLITEVAAQDIIRVVMAYGFDRARLKYGYKLLRGADFDKKGVIDENLRNERFDTLKDKLPDVINVHNWHEFLKSNLLLSKLFEPGTDGNRKSLEKHHLFPKAYLKSKGYTDAKINQMANYAFIDWKDNMDILDDAPSVYYPIICTGRTAEQITTMEVENALPHGWENMQYEEFLIERRKLMAAKIKVAYDILRNNVLN